ARRDFEKWDGELFVDPPSQSSGKKQNPVRSRRTPRPVPPDIRTASNGVFVCPVRSDIDRASRCPVRSDTSRLPLPNAAVGQIQGSLTARAPAQAGGAGSSPAPVANRLAMVAK